MTTLSKNEAIEQSEMAQNKKVDNWSEKAIQLLRIYSKSVSDFITEDFREYAEANGLEVPNEPRAYGGIMVRAKRANIIQSTGQYRNMKHEKSHSCPKTVWESTQPNYYLNFDQQTTKQC